MKFFNNNILAKVNNKVNTYLDENNVVAIRNFSKRYRKQSINSVNEVNFDIIKGQFHALIGSNGAGKTTTIKAIVGATKIFDGQIFINRISNKSSKALSRVAYIPESVIFPTQLTLKSFLKLMGIIKGLKGEELNQRVQEVINITKLNDFVDKKPDTFSSGEQKKALLAQSLLNDVDIFVLDEPAANLDPQTRYELFQILKDLQKIGKSILISSHVLDEVGEYADSVTIIEKGEIKITGYITDFSGKQKHSYSLVPFVKKAFEQYLKTHGIEFTKIAQVFNVDFKTSKEWKEFLAQTAKKNIFFESIQKKELNLKEIYSKYVLNNK